MKKKYAETLSKEFTRCVSCGKRRPISKTIIFKDSHYCSDNTSKFKPSCYMKQVLNELQKDMGKVKVDTEAGGLE